MVYAESVADIQTLLAWANETHTAVIAFGAGTSLEGHIVPQGPAISLDLSPLIASKVDFLADRLVDELRTWGHEIAPAA